MGIVVRILINAAALWVAIAVLDGINYTGDTVLGLLGVALVLGVVNVTVKPVLQLISMPLIVLTLGLFLLLVNGIAMWLVISLSSALGFGITSESFLWTMGAAVVVAIVSWALEMFTGRR